MFDVGFYGGKFIIPHMGHLYAMIKASTMCKELHVIVSYDDKHEATLHEGTRIPELIPVKQRVRWWKQLTKDMPHVHVHAVYEPQTGEYSDWEVGANGIREAIGKPIDAVFSSERSYEAFLSRLYPGAQHVVVDPDRKKFPVSGTAIRRDGVFAHWDMIPPVVREYFVKKIAVVGTESNGKSTLVKNLASIYGTNYVEEWGRTFYERMGDFDTMPEDYAQIAVEHAHHVSKAVSDSRKLMFVDTEAFVTDRFSIEYEGAEVKQPVVQAIAKNQKFDLWLFLEPDVEWVPDGSRILGEQSVRNNVSSRLKNTLDENGIQYVTISGDYHQRLVSSMKAVDQLL